MSRRRLIATVAVAAAALVVASCSTTPPEIVRSFWQVNLVHNPQTGETNERLSFFVQVSNTDGVTDLGTVYLLNDAGQIYWRLDPSNWTTSDRNGELWVGSNFLQMPDGSTIPRGSYRVLVSNLAGERAAGSIFVSADRLDAGKVSFPTISQQGGRVVAHGTGAEGAMWLYNPEGGLVGSRPAVASGYPLASLAPGPKRTVQLTVYAYEYDKACGCGLVNGPFDVTGSR